MFNIWFLKSFGGRVSGSKYLLANKISWIVRYDIYLRSRICVQCMNQFIFPNISSNKSSKL